MAADGPTQDSCQNHPLHLLLAEDEPELATVVSEYFSDAGYSVTKASDGIEAIEALSTTLFDLLLTDICMPRLDGVKLVQHVRKLYPDMPIVVLSGYMTEDHRNALGRLGLPDRAVLEKPSSLVLLEKAIRGALVSDPK
jgi:two-component system cell cycle sensor histidine kinase/response regulator CckA